MFAKVTDPFPLFFGSLACSFICVESQVLSSSVRSFCLWSLMVSIKIKLFCWWCQKKRKRKERMNGAKEGKIMEQTVSHRLYPHHQKWRLFSSLFSQHYGFTTGKALLLSEGFVKRVVSQSFSPRAQTDREEKTGGCCTFMPVHSTTARYYSTEAGSRYVDHQLHSKDKVKKYYIFKNV